MKPQARDLYTHNGRVFVILRDAHGKASSMVPHDGIPYTRELCAEVLAAYLADKGRFDEVLAAIKNPAAVIDTTVTHWRPRAEPSASTSTLAPEPDAPALTPCPSCDGPLTVGAKVCPTCGARTCL